MFGLTDADTARFTPATPVAVVYSVANNSGRMPVVLAALLAGLILCVTKPMPVPVAEVSPIAQGTIGLLTIVVLPPVRPRPPAAVKLILVLPAPAAAPRLSPLNKTVAPATRLALANAREVEPPAPPNTVTVESFWVSDN